MASSMWDTLLGGDSEKPYPVRVGDQCFNKTAASAQVDMHALGTNKEDCCKQCRDKRDFDGVPAEEITTVLTAIERARGSTSLTFNRLGISPVLLDYFHDIASAGANAHTRVADLLVYAKLFYTVDSALGTALTDAANALPAVQSAKAAQTAAAAAAVATKDADDAAASGTRDTSADAERDAAEAVATKAAEDAKDAAGKPADSVLSEALSKALKDVLVSVATKLPFIALSADRYAAALKRKTQYLDADGTVQSAPGVASVPPASTSGASCGPQSARMTTLQHSLIEQLTKLGTEVENKDADALCGLSCSEDVEMDRMMAMYEKLSTSSAGAQVANCELTKFDDDDTLKLLEQKKKMLEAQSFAFLHAECEAVEQCAPHKDVIPTSLIGCSGLHESEILFNDTSMAAIGQFLAGAQRDGQSPGALGHASRLYATGTIAPGVNKDELWINVCYRVVGKADGADGAVDSMWVRANMCEQRKYETLRAIQKAITEQKRAILALNREILDLQYEVSSASQKLQNPADFFSTDRRDGAKDSSREKLAIKHSVARAANSLRRNSDRRNSDRRGQRPQLLEADDDMDDRRGDPQFARMMRTLARSVRGRAQMP